MKRNFFWTAILLMALNPLLNAQKADKPVWKELKTFHGLMSSSFHPAEEGNFTPLKQKADSLLLAARNWLASSVPADFKPAETKAALEKLVAQCTRVKKEVDNKAPDEVLMKNITEAHNVFHTITGECRKSDDH